MRRARLGLKLTGLECTSLASRQAAEFAAAACVSSSGGCATHFPAPSCRASSRSRERLSDVLASLPPRKKSIDMTSTDQERWRKVKDQLRSELGEDVFSSWFGRMELEAVQNGSVRLSVPTRFLRNWIQSHYSEKVLLKWQSEEPDVTRLELT